MFSSTVLHESEYSKHGLPKYSICVVRRIFHFSIELH